MTSIFIFFLKKKFEAITERKKTDIKKKRMNSKNSTLMMTKSLISFLIFAGVFLGKKNKKYSFYNDYLTRINVIHIYNKQIFD